VDRVADAFHKPRLRLTENLGIVGLLVMAGIGLFLVTSAVGRAWCGYACPQTVWTDLFQHVERYIDGDRNAQTRLERAPWGPQKIAKRLGKWSVWLFIAFWTGGAWIMYFADAPTLVRDFWSGEAAPVAHATVGILTATTFIFGGFITAEWKSAPWYLPIPKPCPHSFLFSVNEGRKYPITSGDR
jgi:polyferredoxin